MARNREISSSLLTILIFALFNTSIIATNPFVSASNSEINKAGEISLSNCSTPEWEYKSIDDDDAKNDDSYISKLSRGDLANDFVRRLRNKSSEYYGTVVDNILMYLCDVEVDSVRCVSENSPDAAKDSEGNFIYAAESPCDRDSNEYERSSNCYWNSVVSDQVRTERFTLEQFDKSKEYLIGQNMESYVGGLFLFAVAGITLAAVSSFVWGILFLGRCCCCCLWSSICSFCSPRPRKRGYNNCFGIRLPANLYFLCVVAVSGTAAIAYVGNTDISKAITKTFEHSQGLIGDVDVFLEGSRVPLVNVGSIVRDAAEDAMQIFDGTEYVRKTATEFSSSLRNFGVLYNDGLEKSGSKNGFDEAVSGFDEQIEPIVDEVQNMLDTLEIDLAGNVDIIEDSIFFAVEQIDSILNQTSEWMSEVDNIEEIEKKSRKLRQIGVMSFFILVFVVSICGLIAIVTTRCTSCTNIYILNIVWFLGSILGTLAFILASVVLLLSIIWYDACQISDVLITDFEPFVGDQVALGANACFNNTNLAVAFNVTSKVTFQAKLDEGLAVIQDVNVTEKFDGVTAPLKEIQSMLSKISDGALDYLNQATSVNEDPCPFTDVYSKKSVLKPWRVHSGKSKTTWVVKTTGKFANLNRVGKETATQYMSRIYSVAGKCTSPTEPCCLENVCSVGLEWCNSGAGCNFLCGDMGSTISQLHAGYIKASTTENKMSADLGVICPVGYACPTEEFRGMGHNNTIYDLLLNYESNLKGTIAELVNVASNSVGKIMQEIMVFLCNMDCSFVESRFRNVQDQVCEKMLGGFIQVSSSFWAMAAILELSVVIAAMLSVRLRGVSREVAMLDEDEFFLSNMAPEKIMNTE